MTRCFCFYYAFHSSVLLYCYTPSSRDYFYYAFHSGVLLYCAIFPLPSFPRLSPKAHSASHSLAFTRYCHHLYCMVYGINREGRWRGAYCAMVAQ